ncbi:hypothetical protein HWC53_gp138 [Bacillus phage vB_BmeM-Goe8]|uniref:Uncharacterized protein n=1 Tax=Bacillus phage vB_BmeM-Goe8 TaxID=2593638 RepID=A0A516KMX5_9CAUD|nr:hypothetical protein HWC53_gp138 [Bacillus phage vB_BmeM-Goe8]QDP42951.1 hypothetical protein Goe8_c01780 [Bacillus phage vB_BmeM-Goe8]
MEFFTNKTEKYRKDAEEYKQLWEEEQKKVAMLEATLGGVRADLDSRHRVILRLERIVRKGTTQATREDIRKLTLNEIESLIKEATLDLSAYKNVKSHYTPYSHHMSLGRIREKDRETIVMETIIGEMEEYIENLTREKYRKILDAEEKGGSEQ